MILVYEQELTHYRVPVFASLNDAVGEAVFVVHGDGPSGNSLNTVDENEGLSFEHDKVSTYWVGGDKVALQNVWSHAVTKNPSTVILRGAIRQLHLFPLLLYYKLRGVPVVVWGQGYSRKRTFRPAHHLVDRVYLSIVQLADAYICYTEEIKKTLAKHCSPEKLFVANNTLSIDDHIKTKKKLEAVGRETIRNRLNPDRKHYLCFIGRLQPRKQVGYLLEVYRQLRVNHQMDVGLIIIGDGPERERLEQKATRMELSDVHFVGAQYGEDAGRYLVAADAMVMPGWLGLAVNHALAYGLPVISQQPDNRAGGVTHAPESVHVRHRETGWLAKTGQPDSMVEGVREILNHADAYSERCVRYARQNLTMKNMMEGFTQGIAYARGNRSRK
jgi:glycosyltransferase involved in cell wall biosynthesis